MATNQYIKYPNNTGGGVSSLNGLTGSLTIVGGTGITVTPSGSNITISATNFGTVTAVTASAPLSSSGGTTPNISITQSGTSTDGYLSSVDWNTFNSKQPAGNYITSLTGGVIASGPGAAAATVVTNANLTGDVTSVGNATTLVATTNSTLTTLSALSLPYSQVTGTPTPLVFADSLVNTGGTVTLVNDTATPTASTYYGTNAGSVLGYYALPASSGGTVTSVSVVSANGFAGTVATATTTPAITIETTVTGILNGNGTSVTAAVAGTDYVIPSGSITGTASNITATTNSTLTTLTALSLPYSQVTGTPTPLVFADSLVNTSGTVTLVNDTATPAASSYYGTNASSVLGYYSLPTSANPIQLAQISTPANPPTGSNDLYFKPTGSTSSVASSPTETNSAGMGTPTDWNAQSFIPTSTGNITTAILNLFTSGGAVLTGSMVVGLYSNSSGAPGTLLSTSSLVNASTLTTSPAPISFSFISGAPMTMGTTYWIVFNPSSVVFTSGSIEIQYADPNPYGSGNLSQSTNSGVSWSPVAAASLQFEVDAMTASGGALYTLNSLGVETEVGGGGFTNPMTTAGDMIYENSTPAPARLPIGTAGQFLNVVSGLPAWTSASPSGQEFYFSSQVTTASSGITSATFTTFSNSPALTVTPILGGSYKVYSVFQSYDPTPIAANVRIFNTSGGATLQIEQQSFTTSSQQSQYTFSIYTLAASSTYVFDIQGAVGSSGTLYARGDQAPFYMVIERIGN